LPNQQIKPVLKNIGPSKKCSPCYCIDELKTTLTKIPQQHREKSDGDFFPCILTKDFRMTIQDEQLNFDFGKVETVNFLGYSFENYRKNVYYFYWNIFHSSQLIFDHTPFTLLTYLVNPNPTYFETIGNRLKYIYHRMILIDLYYFLNKNLPKLREIPEYEFVETNQTFEQIVKLFKKLFNQKFDLSEKNLFLETQFKYNKKNFVSLETILFGNRGGKKTITVDEMNVIEKKIKEIPKIETPKIKEVVLVKQPIVEKIEREESMQRLEKIKEEKSKQKIVEMIRRKKEIKQKKQELEREQKQREMELEKKREMEQKRLEHQRLVQEKRKEREQQELLKKQKEEEEHQKQLEDKKQREEEMNKLKMESLLKTRKTTTIKYD
jgi:hypothetical protein